MFKSFMHDYTVHSVSRETRLMQEFYHHISFLVCIWIKKLFELANDWKLMITFFSLFGFRLLKLYVCGVVCTLVQTNKYNQILMD